MKKLNLDIQRFASTNKTANYNLPQFIGTDKPTWLGDINQAMFDIDAGMHTNASDIESVETIAQNASASASQASQDVAGLTSTVNTLSSNVTSVTQTANNAQQTATSALNTANTANGKADTNASNISALTTRVTTAETQISNFNLTKFTTPTLTRASGSFTVNPNSTLTIATNSDGSLAKIYGIVNASNVKTAGVITAPSSLRPDSDIIVSPHMLRLNYALSGDNINIHTINGAEITIKTDGTIEIPISLATSGDSCRCIINDSLLFVKDFGDAPIGD